jgi:hypothetical protein
MTTLYETRLYCEGWYAVWDNSRRDWVRDGQVIRLWERKIDAISASRIWGEGE